MLIRAAIVSCLLILTTLPAAALPAPALPDNGSCEVAPLETLEQLKARRKTLEQEVKALLEKSQDAVSLTKSQEELLKVIFQIDCLTKKPKVAAATAPAQDTMLAQDKKAPASVEPERGQKGSKPGAGEMRGASGADTPVEPPKATAPTQAEKTDPAKPKAPRTHYYSKAAPNPAATTRGVRSGQSAPPPSAEEQAKGAASEGAGAAKPDGAIEITTYYATNRRPTGQVEPASYYGSDSDVAFHYGRATVSIPSTHTIGNLELPALWKLELSTDPKKHFVLTAVAPLTGDVMRKEMAAKLKGMKKKPLLLFVHGYNVSFSEAALRTAQMSYDLKFPGVAMFYSWPSAGSIFGYLHDEEATIMSEVVFESLLRDVAKLPFTDIYIVAHSMGNRIVSQAIEANAGKLPNLRELLLAAPDINAELFRAVIAPKLAALQKSNKTRTTIYASSSDVALQASKVVHGYRRVGETSGGVFTYPGIETIDASSASSMLRDYGHGYLVDSEAVLKDMASIILRRATEKSRGLSEAGKPPAGAYWLLP